MDFCELIDAHIESGADITIAAQPVTPADATQMGIFRFDATARSSASRRSRTRRGSREIGSSIAARLGGRRHHRARSRSSPRWASTSSRARCCSRSLEAAGHRLRQGDHPGGARARHRVQPVPLSRLLGRRRHDRGVLRRQHPADAARRAVQLLPPALADLHAPALPARHAHARLPHRRVDRRRRAATSTAATIARVGGRHPDARRTAARRSRGRCCSAPTSTRRRPPPTPSRSASAATSCSIASSSTRTRASATACGWSTSSGVQEADGDGYYIRNGIIIVPKGGAYCAGGVCLVASRGSRVRGFAGSASLELATDSPEPRTGDSPPSHNRDAIARKRTFRRRRRSTSAHLPHVVPAAVPTIFLELTT